MLVADVRSSLLFSPSVFFCCFVSSTGVNEHCRVCVWVCRDAEPGYWKPYLRTHLIYNLSPLLSTNFLNATLKLDKQLEGMETRPPVACSFFSFLFFLCLVRPLSVSFCFVLFPLSSTLRFCVLFSLPSSLRACYARCETDLRRMNCTSGGVSA